MAWQHVCKTITFMFLPIKCVMKVTFFFKKILLPIENENQIVNLEQYLSYSTLIKNCFLKTNEDARKKCYTTQTLTCLERDKLVYPSLWYSTLNWKTP